MPGSNPPRSPSQREVRLLFCRAANTGPASRSFTGVGWCVWLADEPRGNRRRPVAAKVVVNGQWCLGLCLAQVLHFLKAPSKSALCITATHSGLYDRGRPKTTVRRASRAYVHRRLITTGILLRSSSVSSESSIVSCQIGKFFRSPACWSRCERLARSR